MCRPGRPTRCAAGVSWLVYIGDGATICPLGPTASRRICRECVCPFGVRRITCSGARLETSVRKFVERAIAFVLDNMFMTIVTSLSGVGLGLGFYWARDWVSQPVTLIRAWPAGLATTIIVVVIVWARTAWQLKRRIAALEGPEFFQKPWPITDTAFHLRWNLRRKPDTWLRQDLRAIAFSFTEQTIDGPFHALRNCMHRLSSDDERMLDSVCPICSQPIHTTELNGAPMNVSVTDLKRVTLEQLQRLSNQGVCIRRGLKSDSLSGGLLGKPPA